MSTISKAIADEIIAGKYPEDGCFLLVRYENVFYGNFAYKAYFESLHYYPFTASYLASEIIKINGDNPTIYWIAPWIEEDTRERLINFFGEVQHTKEKDSEEKES